MAARGTVVLFELDLADVERGVYAELSLRVAQHPSEDEAFLVARILARALRHAPRIEFSAGVSAGDEPALRIEDPDGSLATWIEIGVPSEQGLRRACHRAREVLVVTYRARSAPLVRPAGALGERVRVLALDPAFVDALAARVERRNRWSVLRNDGELAVVVGSERFACALAE